MKQMKIPFDEYSFDEEAFKKLKVELSKNNIKILRNKRKKKMYFNLSGPRSGYWERNKVYKIIEKYFPDAHTTSGSYWEGGFRITMASK